MRVWFSILVRPCDKLRDNTEMIRSLVPHLIAPLVSFPPLYGPSIGTRFLTRTPWKP